MRFSREAFQDNLCSRFGINPSRSAQQIPIAAVRDLCCAIVPRYYVAEKNPRIGCFVLPNHPTWDLCITYRKGAYLTDATKDFIAMVKDYWAEHLAPVQTN